MAPTVSSEGGPSKYAFSPKLVAAIIGCLFAFTVIVIGFNIIARPLCCARRPAASTAYIHEHEHVHLAPGGPSRPALSTAEAAARAKCFRCIWEERVARANARREAASALPLPPPPYVHAPPYSPAAPDGSATVINGHAGMDASLGLPPPPPPAYMGALVVSALPPAQRG